MVVPVFSGLVSVLLGENAVDRMAGLTRHMTDQLDCAAAAVTRVAGGRHAVVASRGYDDRTLDYLVTDFVDKDPGMQAVRAEPSAILTWRDIPSYRQTYSVREVFVPAGFSEGTSVVLTSPTGVAVGALHVSVARDSVPHGVKTTLSDAREYAAWSVDTLTQQEEVALTPREHEVLELVIAGLSNREIAQRMQLSRSTVNTHVEHLLRKLKAPNRVGAVVRAVRLGLVSNRDPWAQPT
ncbi:DNA-binding response regulator [Rhodococcus aetherivorans]|uniref:DNA-binding response regulator n=1 Tax=Rhodococcus aetherivorans TaxID=191292 RepID=A0ABQ0YFX5_9NOCA|nr:response regulator transcription factor [Rhodococcus aetherivorans]ETT26292.1 transcriptional regulator, LuxR family [Rhodococcus rhodochrous ATCC 21198]NGP28278.1 response regulator transcription factor [Rhodococcus aetherivorans]GES35428.1 DNA-binding response regulator [Rhodococcus aetherivorans]